MTDDDWKERPIDQDENHPVPVVSPTTTTMHQLSAATNDEASPSMSVTSSSKKWSETLQTPSTEACFSPAFVHADPSRASLHGLGLTVAVDRARSTSACGKKCAKLLYEVSILYETFAQSILKSKYFDDMHAQDSIVDGIQTQQYVSTLLCMGSLRSFAMQMQGLAICIRNDISKPLRDMSTSVGEAAPKIFQKYDRSRSESYKARERALKAQRRYLASVQQAEKLLSDIEQLGETAKTPEINKTSQNELNEDMSKQGTLNIIQQDNIDEHEEEEKSTNDTNFGENNDSEHTRENIDVEKNENKRVIYKKNSSSLVQAGWDGAIRIFSNMTSDNDNSHLQTTIAALQNVKRCQHQYFTAVDEENAAVSRCQTIEVMALESMQNFEQERVKFFNQTMERTAQAERGCLDKMILQDFQNNSSSETVTPNSDDSEEIDKECDVEKLDLAIPPNVVLHDEIVERRKKALISLKRTKKRYDILSKLVLSLEVTLNSADAFAKSINDRLQYDGYNFDSSPPKHQAEYIILSSLMKQNENNILVKRWNNTVIRSLMHLTQNLVMLMIDPLRNILKEKLEKLHKFSEKEIISATESERVRWRHLCDAKQNEIKHKARFDVATATLNKATERLHAIAGAGKANDSIDFSSKDDITTTLSKSMRQSIGGLFQTILGDSETLSNSVLTADDRYQLAQDALSEAVYKEEHAKASYKAANTALILAIDSYKTASTVLVTTSKKQEEVIWNKAKSTLSECIFMLDKFRRARYIHLEKVMPSFTELGYVEESFDWALKLESKLSLHRQKIKNKLVRNAPPQTFLMEARIIDSKIVSEFLVKEANEKDNFAFVGKGCVAIETDLPSIEENVPDAFTSEGIEVKVNNSNENGEDSEDSSFPAIFDVKLFDSIPEIPQLNEKRNDGNSPYVISSAQHKRNRLSSMNADTEMFMEHFFPNSSSDKTAKEIPTVIQSFSCAYWPKDSERHISPLLHGRMFATSSSCCFVGWAGKKIVLQWKNVSRVEKEVTFYGLVPNAVLITCDDGNDYLFGSFLYREEAFNLLNRLSIVARSVVELNEGGSREILQPDFTLSKMQIIINENLAGVTIDQIYRTCWTRQEEEVNGTSKSDDFYANWLNEQKVNFDIDVGCWEENEGGFINEWCGEKYTRKRLVRYKFKRTTHLYIGPPVANVTETQFSRIEGNEKCIIASNVKIDGIPYADSFSVECRWTARRLEAKTDTSCAQIQVGIFVNFRQSSLLNSKIRSSTLEETKVTHSNLFAAVKKVCNGSSMEPIELGEENTNIQIESESYFYNFLQFRTTLSSSLEYLFRHKIRLITMLAFIVTFVQLVVNMNKLFLENKLILLEMHKLREEIRSLREYLTEEIQSNVIHGQRECLENF